jgi:hypothetical protein
MDSPGGARRKTRHRDRPRVVSRNCRGMTVLDWRDPIDWSDRIHWNGGQQAPCVHCSKPALLLDDTGRPAHKVCAEAAATALSALLAQRKAAAEAA